MMWPRTLFGRNLLLIVALIVASEIAWLGIFRVLVQKPRLQRTAVTMREYAEALGSALALLPPGRHADYIAALNAGTEPRLLRADDAPAQLLRPPGPRARLVLGQLADVLGPGYTLRWSERPARSLWMRTRPDGTDYWIRFSARGLIPESPWLLVSGSIVTMLLAAAGAYVVQRRINRPLQALAGAAAALGRGEPVFDLPHDGPREIAVVATSFERMAASLAHADAERALMLAGVSHDMRTPLAKLRLCVEILRGEADAEIIESMTRSIAAADEIIGQFVDFARIGSDEALQLCDLTELVRSVVADFTAAATVELATPGLPPLVLRPAAMRRALSNLLENSRRHAPGEIGIRLARVGERVEMSVLDRGPGIPAEAMARVRQPFARLEEARGMTSGAGLGLAIVERIAHLHGGTLTLANREGGGLAAILSLPLRGIEDGNAARAP